MINVTSVSLDIKLLTGYFWFEKSAKHASKNKKKKKKKKVSKQASKLNGGLTWLHQQHGT